MEYILLILGFVLVVLGFFGSFLPSPGALFSILGLVCLEQIPDLEVTESVFWVLIVLLLLTFVLDFVLPAMFTKKYGGSKYGAWGATLLSIIVAIVMLFLSIPGGFIIASIIGVIMIIFSNFFGALFGELLYKPKDIVRALRASYGSFVGFCAATLVKMTIGMVTIVFYFVEVIRNWEVFAK
ncbi:MAG: DUF456 domain-containing protein [Bacteroidota bacterium]|nr:DUF456 domain-containing protein [Bacteroidota bacterium]